MVTALIILGAVILLLVIVATVRFGESGVSRARENAYWSGGAGPNPRLRYDPEARFKRPPGGD
jgi:hypothetical protein